MSGCGDLGCPHCGVHDVRWGVVVVGGSLSPMLTGVPVVVMPTQPLPVVRGFVVIIIVIRSISSSPVILVQRSPRASLWWGLRRTVCCCCFGVYWGFGFGGQTEYVGDQVAFVEGVAESARDPWW